MYKDLIIDFINNNEVDTIEIDMFPVNDILSVLEKEGWEKHEHNGDETNGWQVDFWYYVTKDTTNICLSGSLFYGNFKLTKEEI